MSDLISRDVGNEREHAKIKTSFAKIIVEGTAKEPYYSILYYDPKRKEYINGYGSYCIDYVFNWLTEEFEINNDAPAVDAEPVRHGRWEADMVTEYKTYPAYTYKSGYKCSLCGRRERTNKEPYCHCGAKMDLEEIR
jgi:hypothetical protein